MKQISYSKEKGIEFLYLGFIKNDILMKKIAIAGSIFEMTLQENFYRRG